MNKENKNKQIISIVKLKIKLKDREIELNSDEARQVYTELKELFEKEDKNLFEKLQEEWNKNNPPQYPYYPAPIIIEKYPEPIYRPWEITCISTEIGKSYMGDPPTKFTCLSSKVEDSNTQPFATLTMNLVK